MDGIWGVDSAAPMDLREARFIPARNAAQRGAFMPALPPSAYAPVISRSSAQIPWLVLEAEAVYVLGGDDHPALALEYGLASLAELERGVAFDAQIQRGGDLFAGE